MKPFLLRLVACLFVVSSSSHAALYDRGNGLIYDDVLDITWMQDVNYAQTSGYDADGQMTWADANTWADQLSYGGYDDWRLPSANLMNPTSPCYADDGSCDKGYNNTTGELGHMFYNNLGNLGYRDTNGNFQSGYGVTNSSFTDGNSGASVSIVNLQNAAYWLGEEYAPITGLAWAFYTNRGYQWETSENDSPHSWAVRDGDVSTVPVPAAAWLFGSALAGLLVARSKNKK